MLNLSNGNSTISSRSAAAANAVPRIENGNAISAPTISARRRNARPTGRQTPAEFLQRCVDFMRILDSRGSAPRGAVLDVDCVETDVRLPRALEGSLDLVAIRQAAHDS